MWWIHRVSWMLDTLPTIQEQTSPISSGIRNTLTSFRIQHLRHMNWVRVGGGFYFFFPLHCELVGYGILWFLSVLIFDWKKKKKRKEKRNPFVFLIDYFIDCRIDWHKANSYWFNWIKWTIHNLCHVMLSILSKFFSILRVKSPLDLIQVPNNILSVKH